MRKISSLASAEVAVDRLTTETDYDNIVKVKDKLPEITTVADGMEHIVNVEAISLDIVQLATSKEAIDALYADQAKLESLYADKANVNAVAADLYNINQSVIAAKEINGLLGVDLGTAGIDANGDLLVSQISANSTPAIDSAGNLTVTYV